MKYYIGSVWILYSQIPHEEPLVESVHSSLEGVLIAQEKFKPNVKQHVAFYQKHSIKD